MLLVSITWPLVAVFHQPFNKEFLQGLRSHGLDSDGEKLVDDLESLLRIPHTKEAREPKLTRNRIHQAPLQPHVRLNKVLEEQTSVSYNDVPETSLEFVPSLDELKEARVRMKNRHELVAANIIQKEEALVEDGMVNLEIYSQMWAGLKALVQQRGGLPGAPDKPDNTSPSFNERLPRCRHIDEYSLCPKDMAWQCGQEVNKNFPDSKFGIPFDKAYFPGKEVVKPLSSIQRDYIHDPARLRANKLVESHMKLLPPLRADASFFFKEHYGLTQDVPSFLNNASFRTNPGQPSEFDAYGCSCYTTDTYLAHALAVKLCGLRKLGIEGIRNIAPFFEVAEEQSTAVLSCRLKCPGKKELVLSDERPSELAADFPVCQAPFVFERREPFVPVYPEKVELVSGAERFQRTDKRIVAADGLMKTVPKDDNFTTGKWCGMPSPSNQEEYWDKCVLKNAGYLNLGCCSQDHHYAVLGYAAMGADVCYPVHQHNNEEAYWQISGGGTWRYWEHQQGNATSNAKEVPGGMFTTRVHYSKTPHEMETAEDEYMLMAYWWAMDFLPSRVKQKKLAKDVKNPIEYRWVEEIHRQKMGSCAERLNLIELDEEGKTRGTRCRRDATPKENGGKGGLDGGG